MQVINLDARLQDEVAVMEYLINQHIMKLGMQKAKKKIKKI